MQGKGEMATQERLLDVDAVWEMMLQPDYEKKRFYVIDGELFEMSPANRLHGNLAIIIGSIVWRFVEEHNLGEVNAEVGYYAPGDRRTLLAPDVAFVSHARVSQLPEEKFVPLMPDLAIEIVSPSNSLRQIRRKAQIYLDQGASLVWIVRPAEKGVDVCRAADGSRLDIEFVSGDGVLSGEDVLPGFDLDVARLFPPSAES